MTHSTCMATTLSPSAKRSLVTAALSLVACLALGSCSIWAALEDLNFPQDEKDMRVLRQVARPDGIDLTAQSALSELQKDANVLGLHSEEGRFDYFFFIVPPTMGDYSKLQELVRFKYPAFLEHKPVGFTVFDFPVDELKLTGREYYFDKDYHLCDGMLFARRPLDTARFLLIIFDDRSSLAALGKPGLLCVFAHPNSEIFKTIRNR